MRVFVCVLVRMCVIKINDILKIISINCLWEHYNHTEYILYIKAPHQTEIQEDNFDPSVFV